MKIGTKEFDLAHKTYVCGILNVTPDSFSDGGKWNHIDEALSHAEQMIKDGAALLDIGGESTRPGYTKISDEEEIARVCPVIEKIKAEFDIPVSVDTYKSAVADAAAQAGADLINDIWGLKYDEKMAEVIKKHELCCCLMHNRDNMDYKNYLEDVKNDLLESVEMAKKAGIAEDQIILDPGVGFAKTREQNLLIVKHLDDISSLGYPVLLGTSRKSMIGLTLNLPVTEREEGTLATTVLAVCHHIGFVRVHNVLSNVRAVKMTEAILNQEEE